MPTNYEYQLNALKEKLNKMNAIYFGWTFGARIT